MAKDGMAALDAHWRAANYLAVGQIYLLANSLLTEPLKPEHIKPRLLGHWVTSPGLNLVRTHLNRVIAERDLDAICVWGPGHGGPAVLANSWLEGSYRVSFAVHRASARGASQRLVMDVITASRASPCAPPPYASGWPTYAPATRPGSANTAPTCPRSRNGPGPTDDDLMATWRRTDDEKSLPRWGTSATG